MALRNGRRVNNPAQGWDEVLNFNHKGAHMKKQIICPTCNSKITFLEGTIVEECIGCKTKFVSPGSVAVKAVAKDATVVQVDPLTSNFSANGGN